jgi:hypothetical protein
MSRIAAVLLVSFAVVPAAQGQGIRGVIKKATERRRDRSALVELAEGPAGARGPPEPGVALIRVKARHAMAG